MLCGMIPSPDESTIGEPAATSDLSTVAAPSIYGPWADHQIPTDRSDWHPLVNRFYEYWRDIAPAGGLPGRQHVSPTDIVPLLPRVWMLDVIRSPLRFRYRLVGTAEVTTLGREVTGQWLDDVHPKFRDDPLLTARYRYIVEMGRPTWRHGPVRWDHDDRHRIVENCIVPLASDGKTVDIIFAISVLFYGDGTLASAG